jgi:hypothetical protein
MKTETPLISDNPSQWKPVGNRLDHFKSGDDRRLDRTVLGCRGHYSAGETDQAAD